jgi:hypothetical protein
LIAKAVVFSLKFELKINGLFSLERGFTSENVLIVSELWRKIVLGGDAIFSEVQDKKTVNFLGDLLSVASPC